MYKRQKHTHPMLEQHASSNHNPYCLIKNSSFTPPDSRFFVLMYNTMNAYTVVMWKFANNEWWFGHAFTSTRHVEIDCAMDVGLAPIPPPFRQGTYRGICPSYLVVPL